MKKLSLITLFCCLNLILYAKNTNDLNKISNILISSTLNEPDSEVNLVRQADDIEFINKNTSYTEGTRDFTFEFNYSASVQREIFAEIRSPQGDWLGGRAVTVNAGSGSTTVTITLNTPPAIGNDYTVNTHIRPVGTDWMSLIKADPGTMNIIPGTGNTTSITIDYKTQRFIGAVSDLSRNKYLRPHFSLPAGDPDLINFLNTYNLDPNFTSSRNFWSPLAKVVNGNVPGNVNDIYNGVRNVATNFVATGHPRWFFSNGNLDYSTTNTTQYSLDVANYVAKSYKDEWDNVPEYFEPMNEPFIHASDFHPGNDGPKNDIIITKMCEAYRDMGRAIHNTPELRNMKIIGFSSAWPEFERFNFGIWKKQKKFMDIAGEDMDGFSVHPYDGSGLNNEGGRRSGSNLEAILDMVENYSYEKFNVVKPMFITEYGRLVQNQPGWSPGNGVSNYHPIENSQAVRSQIHMVMSFMERGDDVMMGIPFTTGKADPNAQYARAGLFIRQNNGSYELTPRKFFFEIWKDVKGKRVNTISTGLESIQIKRVKVPVNSPATLEISSPNNAPDTIDIAYGETVVLSYSFNAPIDFDNSISGEKYYAGSTLRPIQTNQALSYVLNNVDIGTSGYGTAVLRLSIGRAKWKTRNPIIVVNGTNVQINRDVIRGYDQSTRNDFFGTLEIPVPFELIRSGANTISASFSDDGGHVSSVILQVQTYEKPPVTLSSDDTVFNKSFRIYPNPASEAIFISGLKVNRSFSIIDLTGKRLKKIKILGNQKKEIDISDLSDGLYFIMDQKSGSVNKFIKK